MIKNNIKYLNIFKNLLVVLLVFVGTRSLNAQLKVGNNPKALAPNVILEVEATSGNPAVFSKDSAYLGIGTLTPTRKLDIQSSTAGAVKIVDGTQADGKVLTSDANGVATWKVPFTATPQNLTNSNGIIVTGGTGATLSAASLRLDSTAVAKMIGQSPVKDSIATALSKSPIKDSLASQTNQSINIGAITGKDLTNSNGILVTGGTGTTLKTTSLRLDSTAVAKMIGQSPVKDSIATALSKSPIKDSLASQTNQSINIGAITGKDLTNSNGIIVIGGTGTTLKTTSLRLDSTAVAKMIGQSPVKDSIKAIINSQSTNEPWFNVATNTGANDNTQNIYQMGNVGIGTTTPQNKLHVKGQMRVDTLTSGSLATDSVVVVGSNGVFKKTQFNVAPDQALGSVAIFPFSAIPSDYLECNGAAVSRTTYAALFSKIGTIYGVGDGSTTFNLPDLRGEFVRGWDNGRGIDGSRILGSSQLATNVWAGGSNTGVPIVNGGKLTQWESGSGAIGSKIDVNSDAINFTPNIGGSGLMTTAASYFGLSSSFGYYQTRPRNVAMVYAIKAKESVLVPTSTSTAISAAAVANEPWYNVATNTGATENTQNIYQMGNVGIGTTSPSKKLDVVGGIKVGTTAYKNIIMESDTAAPGTYNGIFNIYPATVPGSGISKQATYFKNNGGTANPSTRHDVLVDGKVGIGVNAPATALDVSGGTAVDVNLFQTNNSDAALFNFKNLSSGQLWALNVAGSSPNGGVQASSFTLVNRSNSTTPFVILPSGNVGIGTTTPTAKLSVIESGSATAGYFNSATGAGIQAVSSANAAGVSGSSQTNAGGYFTTNGVLNGTYAIVGSSLNANASAGGVAAALLISQSGTYLAAGYQTTYGAVSNGNLHVAGNLSKTGGTFKIDHPQDPENKYLIHSFVESPDMMNIYNGNVTTDANGNAIISLPDYFFVLNKDFRYQLTSIGTFSQAIVMNEVSKENTFSIKTEKPNVKVSWQVTGIRQDNWANQNRIKDVEDKLPEHRGKYLNPEAFGQPKEQGIFYIDPLKYAPKTDSNLGGKVIVK